MSKNLSHLFDEITLFGLPVPFFHIHEIRLVEEVT